jgi:hypothetical protein
MAGRRIPAAIVIAFATTIAAAAVGVRTSPSAGEEAVWSITVEPAEPRVGDKVLVSASASGVCCSPLLFPSLRISQPQPAVFDAPAKAQNGVWSLHALREGEAQLTVTGSFERWVCLGTPTPVVVVPPFCVPTMTFAVSPTLTVTVSAAVPAPTAEALAGDVNCDGVVTAVDATLLLQEEAGTIAARPPPCLAWGDMNRDCRLNSLDAALVLQLTAGLIAARPGRACS